MSTKEAHELLGTTPDDDALTITTNFKLCADCHAFIKHASALLARRVRVQERKLLHVFERGRCSCNDEWRWETRLRTS